MFTHFIEHYYAQGIYPLFNSKLSQLTGSLPFSLAEFIIVGGSCFLLWSIWRSGKSMFQRGITFQTLYRITLKFIIVLGSTYVLFLFLWGLNYHRSPFGELVGLDVKASTSQELEGLCSKLVARTNSLRLLVAENQAGIMTSSTPADVLQRASLGYKNAARDYPKLGGNYGQPKVVFFSRAMSYLGIWGVYFPFTAEANVNVSIPANQLPAITCHEMAHQRGFAREEEANYIAYLVTKYHPDIDFKYSGSLLALVHSMHALKAYNPDAVITLQAQYNPGVKRDLAEVSRFAHQYEGPIEDFSATVNNYYLKANKQQDGIQSYGRMVDLLLAEYRETLE